MPVRYVKNHANKAISTSSSTPTSSSKPTSSSEVTTSTGLKYKDVRVGTGNTPKKESTVFAQLRGKLLNGYEFHRLMTIEIMLRKMIPGLYEGILSMKVGGHRIMTIPPSLAFGDRWVGSIPPNSTIVYDVELINIM
jgi:peptidylprolyl isomerase